MIGKKRGIYIVIFSIIVILIIPSLVSAGILSDFWDKSKSGNEIIRSMWPTYNLFNEKRPIGMRFWTFAARFAHYKDGKSVEDPHELAMQAGAGVDPFDEIREDQKVRAEAFIHEGDLAEAFSTARGALERIQPISLWLAYCLYIAGIIAFAWVMLQNILYVINY